MACVVSSLTEHALRQACPVLRGLRLCSRFDVMWAVLAASSCAGNAAGGGDEAGGSARGIRGTARTQVFQGQLTQFRLACNRFLLACFFLASLMLNEPVHGRATASLAGTSCRCVETQITFPSSSCATKTFLSTACLRNAGSYSAVTYCSLSKGRACPWSVC